MTKAKKETTPASAANRLRIRLLWRLFEVEGEGPLSVLGALVLGLLLFGWMILHH